MKIQFNTDKTIDGDESNQKYFSDLIAKKLSRYDSHITRIEVHISDENGEKEGANDIRCLLEARFEGRQPIVVSDQTDTIKKSVSGAIDKMKAALETVLGRMQDR